MNNKPKFSKKKLIIVLLTILLILTIPIIIYVNNYYKAIPTQFMTVEPVDAITITTDSNGNIMYKEKNSNSKVGFIFYPGGKVDEKAYHNLALSCANFDLTTFIVSMPFKLAVFDSNAADDIIKNHPEIETWYIGGHSLGGSMAATYTSKNQETISGLILLGAYSTSEINNTKVISIYGSNDKVLNLENYEKYKTNISYLEEHVIEGGNHSYFGSYGEQKGDGTATITPRTQISYTANLINEFINNK